MPTKRLPQHLRLALLAACVAGLAACATGYAPGALAPGSSAADAVRTMGPPTGEHRGTAGGRRLEFARGPFGKHTYMLDFDAQDRLVGWEQVLDEAHFNAIQAGIGRQELLFRLGRPGRVWAVRYHDQTVYSYRFEGPFCLLFHVGITPQGVVEDTSYGPDPLCERKDRFGM